MEVSRCPRRRQRRGRLPSFSGDVVRTLTTLLCPLLRSFSSYSKGQRSVVSAVAAPGQQGRPAVQLVIANGSEIVQGGGRPHARSGGCCTFVCGPWQTEPRNHAELLCRPPRRSRSHVRRPPSAHMGARRLIVTVVKYPRNINEKRHRPHRVPSLPCARSASAPERAARPPGDPRRRSCRAPKSDHPARPWPPRRPDRATEPRNHTDPRRAQDRRPS